MHWNNWVLGSLLSSRRNWNLFLGFEDPDFMKIILWPPVFCKFFSLWSSSLLQDAYCWLNQVSSLESLCQGHLRPKIRIVWQISSVLFVMHINQHNHQKGRQGGWSQCRRTLLSSLGTHLCATCRRGMPSSAWTRWRERSFFLRAPKGKFQHISCKIKAPRINSSISKAKLYCGLKRVKESKASPVGARKDVKRGGVFPSVWMGHLQNINVIADAG